MNRSPSPPGLDLADRITLSPQFVTTDPTRVVAYERELAALERDLFEHDLPQDSALAVIAEQARVMTHADGAAIALGCEPAVCRASAGFAPPLGVELRPDCGLSGECLRTGRAIHCSDTLNDSRVNAIARAEQKIRSVLVVPLRSNGHASGFLEVLALDPERFQEQQIELLTRLAGLVERLCGKNGTTPAESAEPASPASTADLYRLLTSESPQSAAEPPSTVALATIQPHSGKAPAVAAVVVLLVLSLGAGWIWRRTLSARQMPKVASQTESTPQVAVGKVANASTPAPSLPPPASQTKTPADGDNAYALGLKYKLGQGVAQDDIEAAKWFRKAAEAGHPDGQYEFATAAAEGRGIPRDYVMAYSWYVLARASGSDASEQAIKELTPKLSPEEIGEVRYELGIIYRDGIGVRKDPTRAYMWFALAEAAGNQHAAAEELSLTRKMRFGQVREAEQLAQAWLKKH